MLQVPVFNSLINLVPADDYSMKQSRKVYHFESYKLGKLNICYIVVAYKIAFYSFKHPVNSSMGAYHLKTIGMIEYMGSKFSYTELQHSPHRS